MSQRFERVRFRNLQTPFVIYLEYGSIKVTKFKNPVFSWFSLVHLFNDISTPNGLFDTEIRFICNGLSVIITISLMFYCIFYLICLCTVLYDIKYSYPIQIICTQFTGKYRFKYMPLAVKGPIGTLLQIGAHILLLSIYITYNANSKTILTLIQITPIPRWTSADKSGRKAIQFATHLFYFLNTCFIYCFEFFVRIESLSVNVGKYMGPR